MAKSSEPVAQTRARIEKWARKNMPGLVEDLAPPASRAAIDRLEKSLGFALPADAIESLPVHDGERGDGKLLDSHEGLLSVEAIEEQMARERRQIARNGNLVGESVSGPARIVHAVRMIRMRG